MFRKRKKLTEELPEKVVRRVKLIPTADLITWAESNLYEAHRNLAAYRARPDAPEAAAYFFEVRQCTEAMLAVLRELEERTGAP